MHKEAILDVAPTPVDVGAEVLGVVGFPGDKKTISGEGATLMCEAWLFVQWNLLVGGMVSHDIPTFTGMDPQPL